MTNRIDPTSTTYSSLKRMLKSGLLIKEDGFSLEDPFFRRWLLNYLR